MRKAFLKEKIFYLTSLFVLSSILSCTLVRAQTNPEVHVIKVEYQGLRDPFKSPFETQEEEIVEIPKIADAQLTHLHVQGMVWDSEMPQAIINDRVLKVGEVIEGAKIIDIQKGCIYVLYEGRQYTLKPKIPKKGETENIRREGRSGYDTY